MTREQQIEMVANMTDMANGTDNATLLAYAAQLQIEWDLSESEIHEYMTAADMN